MFKFIGKFFRKRKYEKARKDILGALTHDELLDNLLIWIDYAIESMEEMKYNPRRKQMDPAERQFYTLRTDIAFRDVVDLQTALLQWYSNMLLKQNRPIKTSYKKDLKFGDWLIDKEQYRIHLHEFLRDSKDLFKLINSHLSGMSIDQRWKELNGASDILNTLYRIVEICNNEYKRNLRVVKSNPWAPNPKYHAFYQEKHKYLKLRNIVQ